MNCGVLCISEFLHDEELNEDLLMECEEGLSFESIIMTGRRHGYEFVGIHDKNIPEPPFLMLRKRHYYFIKEKKKNCYLIYDPNLGYLNLPAWFFKRFYSGYCLVVL